MLLSAATMGCTNKPFYPVFCDIVNSNTLACRPTEGSKPEFDLSTLRALGYRCVSPDDWAEAKKRLRIGLEIEDAIFPMDID